mgnify:CR=1 FL=1
MEIELRSGPMMVTLLGALRDRIVGVHTLKILTPLLERVRGAIESNAIMHDWDARPESCSARQAVSPSEVNATNWLMIGLSP